MPDEKNWETKVNKLYYFGRCWCQVSTAVVGMQVSHVRSVPTTEVESQNNIRRIFMSDNLSCCW